MPVQYESTAVRAHDVDQLVTDVAAFLNELERSPRDWKAAPFVDKFGAEKGVYCALVIAEVPEP